MARLYRRSGPPLNVCERDEPRPTAVRDADPRRCHRMSDQPDRRSCAAEPRVQDSEVHLERRGGRTFLVTTPQSEADTDTELFRSVVCSDDLIAGSSVLGQQAVEPDAECLVRPRHRLLSGDIGRQRADRVDVLGHHVRLLVDVLEQV